MTLSNAPNRRDASHPGPSLPLLSIVVIVLVLACLASQTLGAGAPFPSPFRPDDVIQTYFASHTGAVGFASFLMFGAAIPLGLYTATVASRLRFLGVRAAGTSITEFGGYVSAAFLMLSGLIGWVMSLPEMTHTVQATRTLQNMMFAAGGPGHIVPLGLLVAGVSVTCYFTRLLPRAVAIAGVGLAVICELSSLSLVWQPAMFLLPAGRFLSLIWLLLAGALLPRKGDLDANSNH